MRKYGFLGIPFPKNTAGRGCDTLAYIMCVEELSVLRNNGRNRVRAYVARLKPH